MKKTFTSLLAAFTLRELWFVGAFAVHSLLPEATVGSLTERFGQFIWGAERRVNMTEPFGQYGSTPIALTC